MDVEVIVCDICGEAGKEKLLAICNKCGDGAEHIYCMRVKMNKVPEGDWMCEECMVRSECQKSESPVNLESWNSSELKFKSSHDWKRQTEGMSSTSHVAAKRHGVPPKAHYVKKGSVIGISAEPLRSPKPCDNSVKQSSYGKDSVKQCSYGSRKKPKLPKVAQTDIARDKCSLLKTGSSKTLDLKFKGQLAKGGHLQKRKVERAFDDIRKGNNLRKVSKSVSFNSVSFEKLNASCSEVILESAYHPVVFKNSSSAEETMAEWETEKVVAGSSLFLEGRINSLFLCGVFRGHEVNNSPNTPVSNSQKLENRDILSSGALDLNAYPADGNGMVRVDEVGKFDSIGASSSGDRLLLGGDSYNAGCSDSSRSLDGGKKKSELPMVEENDADNVEVQGKLTMEENNNADKVELSSPSSPSLVSPTICEEDMDLFDLLAAVTLFSLSKGLRTI